MKGNTRRHELVSMVTKLHSFLRSRCVQMICESLGMTALYSVGESHQNEIHEFTNSFTNSLFTNQINQFRGQTRSRG